MARGASSRTQTRAARRRPLPVPAGSFVGRAVELGQLLAMLGDGTRILTLLGPPGTGKTRLALEAARIVRDGHPARAPVFVDLSSTRTLDEAAAELASALGVTVRPSAPPAEVRAAIALALEGTATLLVLDNVEQLVAAVGVADWVRELVERAPDVTVLLTSRELLRVRGEQAIEVPPLGVPADGASPAEARAAESVALLFSAAPQPPSEDDVEALAAVARALEGIPLALELAASRLPVLGAAALRDRLAESLPARLDVLGRGRRDAPDRQATLRGAFDWSWTLLDPAERRGMFVLALVRGSIAPPLAERLLDRATPGTPRGASLDVLQSLRDKSLVARGESGALHLLESLRAYAIEQLAGVAPQLSVAIERAVVLGLAEEAARLRAGLRGPRSRAAFEGLAALREPLRSAIELGSALREKKSEAITPAAAELALALEAVRARIGIAGSLEPVLSELRTAHGALPAETIAEVASALARLLRDRGELRGATSALEEAIDRAPSAEARSLLVELGELLLAQGRFDEAREPLEEARGAARTAGDLRSEQRAEAVLGLLAHGKGALAEADRHYTRALDLAHRLGDGRAESHALRDLGNLALQRGEHDTARAFYEDALELAHGGDYRLEGVVRGNLAILRQEQGHLDDALSELRRALTCLRAVGDLPFEGQLLGYLGAVQHERGQIEQAKETYQKAVAILREVRDLRLEGLFLAARAAALAETGQIGHAKNDLSIASRRLDEVGDPTLLGALSLHRAAVAYAESRTGSPDAQATALRGANAALEATAALAASSDDIRFASRMLRRTLPKEALVVGDGGRWFRTEGGDRVDLSTRATLARVLDALATARLEQPGAPVAWDAILAAGWPGERVLPQAGQNRVRVALTALRNLGLRTVLVTQTGGHALDPAVRLERAS